MDYKINYFLYRLLNKKVTNSVLMIIAGHKKDVVSVHAANPYHGAHT